MTPEQLQDYITQYGSAMTQGGAALGSANYQNSPGYDAQFGSGVNNAFYGNAGLTNLLAQPQLTTNDFLNSDAYKVQYGDSAAAKSTDPNVRFQNDPGMQQAIAAGMPMLANSYASKGLGASGPAANGVAQYMYNNYLGFTGNQGTLYNQQYNNKLTQQQQNVGTYLNQQQAVGGNFNNYQSNLANLSGMGATMSNQQAQNAQQSGQSLSTLLAQLQAGAGTGISGNNMSAGNDIASILANLGINNANALLGTGSAMSGNILSGSQLGAQLANAQNQSNGQNQTAQTAQLGRYF